MRTWTFRNERTTNSGGPAVDADGKVVGIDCMTFGAQPNLPDGGTVIIPIEEAMSLINDFVTSQAVPSK